MKIVMNEKGAVIARHADGDDIQPRHYSEVGPVLIGLIDDRLWSQDSRGEDRIDGSVIDVARDLAYQMTRGDVASMLAGLRIEYPQEERDTWPTKIAEAQAVLAGGSIDDTIYLKAVATVTGMDAKALAKKVIDKATEYASAVASAEAFRSARYEAIDKAKNIKAIVAVVSG